MLDNINQALAQLHVLDWLVIVLNLVLLIFSGVIASKLSGTKDEHSPRRKLVVMRVMSTILLILYLLSLFTSIGVSTECDQATEVGGCDPLRRLSLTGLTILFSYVVYILSHAWIVRRYGRSKEIEGSQVKYATYQSELFSVLVLIAIILMACLTVLTIWEVERWLRGTSVLGGVALFLFFTKDVWLPDNINGLILLYNSEVEPGAVVKVDDLDLLGVTLRTSLVQTTFRDLVRQHLIIIPNARLRAQKIEVLTQCGSTGLRDYVEFKIGYEFIADRVEPMLVEIWKAACKVENAINPDVEPRISLIENGDHAITWRLMYTVRNVYRVMPSRYAVQKAAHEISNQTGIGLNTPLTHQSI